MPQELWRRAFRILWNNYQRSARNRNIAWRLLENQFFKIVSSPCHYCGIEPRQRVWTKNPARTFLYNGVDRKDNDKGYSPTNCLPCCAFCNALKGATLTYEEMKVVTRALYSYRKSKRRRKKSPTPYYKRRGSTRRE